MKRILKRIGIGLIALLLVLFIALNIYASTSYKALDEMYDALEQIEDNRVTVLEDKDEISFSVQNPLMNIILIPGGLVEPESYSYLAYNLALEGYDVTIAKAPYNLAILNQHIGEKFLSDTVENVVIGHSLGGVTASMVFSGNDQVDFIILLGSYPIRDIRDKQTLYISAEHDIAMDMDAFTYSFSLVNSQNTVIDITGGNHAQFGWYGPQKGDGESEIDTQTQQNLVVNYILAFLQQ